MILAILALCLCSFVIAWTATLVIRPLARWVGFVDKPGGRKIHDNPKSLGGGLAIFLGIALPWIAGLGHVWYRQPPTWEQVKHGSIMTPMSAVPGKSPITGRDDLLAAYWSGARQHTPLAVGIIAAALVLHLMGLIDDRKALGPYLKLAIQLGVTAALVIMFKPLRVLTALDSPLHLGPTPSILITVLWIAGITNAFNFLDNMDGLSAGVAAVCTVAFLITALTIQQWFVAAALAMLLGSILGFLCFNFPPATIFMGDSGSLLIGFMLGVLTVRTTYLPPGMNLANGWYAVFVPVLVLALPLYDLVVVSAIRLKRGKSPFVGDTNHFSHRLVARGMSRRTAVLCLYLVTAATSVGAILLPQVQTTHAAILIFCQTMLILGVVMLLEQHPLPVIPDDDQPTPAADERAHKEDSTPKELATNAANSHD
jgi:UDP-GlcNAc:undecaprenyl-phosphate GlcNAc-1-phosphate transferase